MYVEYICNSLNRLRWPGIEPGSPALRAAMLTNIPLSQEKCDISPKFVFFGIFVCLKSQTEFWGEVGSVRGLSIDNSPINPVSDDLESAKYRFSSTSQTT